MAKLGTAYVDIIGNFAPLNKSIAANRGRIASRMAAIGKAGALAGAALGVAAVKSSIDFQHSMTLVQTQAGASRKEVDKLSESILDFAGSGKTEFTPKELADSLFRVESAGIRGAQAMKTLKASSDLATIGQAELEDTTKALVAAQKTGIHGSGNLKKAIGTLNATVGSGQLKLTDLVGALGTGFLATSRAAGLSLTDVGAALAEVTKQGTPARAGATRLRMAFSLMAAPTDTAQKALASIGLEQFDLANAMRDPKVGIVGAMELLKEHLEDLSKTERLDIIRQAFGGARSGGTILQLLQNTGDLDETFQHIRKHADEVNEALERAHEDPAVRLQEAYAQLSSILVRLGSKLVPVVVDGLSDIAAIISDPKLSGEEKFSKITQLLAEAITDASPKIAGAAVKLGAQMALGISRGFLQANTIEKLFIAGALIRIIGGKGALIGSGAAIGRLLGIGVGTGVAQGVAASTAATGAAAGAGAAGGGASKLLIANASGAVIGTAATAKAAGQASGKAAGLGFMAKASSVLKNVRWARVAGIGAGVVLVDSVLSTVDAEAKAKSPEFAEALGGIAQPRGLRSISEKLKSGFLGPVLGPLTSLAGESNQEQAAKRLQELLLTIQKSGKAVPHGAFKEITSLLAQLPDLSDEARAGVEQFLQTGHGLRDWRDQLRQVASEHAVLTLQNDFEFLRNAVPRSMKDISSAVKSGTDIINKNLGGKKTKQGREALAEQFRLSAKAIKRGMDSGAIHVKRGRERIEQILRKANILDPTRKMARNFGREWADGLDKAKHITRGKVDEIIGQLKGLDDGAQKIAIRGFLKRLRVLVREKEISKKTYKDIRSQVLGDFTDIDIGGRKKSFSLGSTVIDNIFGLASGIGQGFNWIKDAASKALKSFGAKKLNFEIGQPKSGGAKSGLHRQRGGGASAFDVPDRGPMGDRWDVPLKLERGERGYILNRNAAGMERHLETLNKKYPRFGKQTKEMAQGGLVQALGPFDIPPIQFDPNHAGGNSHLHLSFTSPNIAQAFARQIAPLGWTASEAPWAGGLTVQHQDPGHATGAAFDANAADESRSAVAEVAHLLGGKLGAGGAFKKLKRVILEGPDGELKDGGQAILDKVLDAANDKLAKMAPAGDVAGVAGSWKGINTSAELEAYWRRTNPDVKEFATAFGIIVPKESGFNPHAINHIGLGHAGWYQFDPPTWNQFKPKGATSSWPAGPFDPGLATLAAGNVARTEGWGGVTSRWAETYGGRVLGGLVEPILGSLREGGMVLRDGVYRLHANEFVQPMKKGGKVGGPIPGEDFIIALLRSLKRKSDAFEVQFPEKDRKELHKLIQKREEGKLSDSEKRRLKDLKDERRKARREAKKERREFAKLMQKAIHATGAKQIHAINEAMKKVRVNFSKKEEERLRKLQREQRHPGLTHEQRQALRKIRKKEEEIRQGGVDPDEKKRLERLRDRERKLEFHKGGLTPEQHRELRHLRREQRLEEKQKDTRDLISVQEKLIESEKVLHQDLREHNHLYKTIRSNEKAAVNAAVNMFAHQIGARGAQKARLGGWGVDRRY